MFFFLNVIREYRAIKYAFTIGHNLDLSLLKQWSVFFQNASGKPFVNRNVKY